MPTMYLRACQLALVAAAVAVALKGMSSQNPLYT